MSFDGLPSVDGFQPATTRMSSTLCFDAQPPDGIFESSKLEDGEFELCGELVDRFDDSVFQLPCRIVASRPDAETAEQIVISLDRLLASPPRQLSQLISTLDQLKVRARDGELPLLEVRLELIVVHFLTLQGGQDALEAAQERLAALPAWLDQPAASERGAQAAYQRALFALDAEQKIGEAWTFLRQADQRYHRIADPNRFLATVQQAVILTRVGARSEAVAQLQNAVTGCSELPCDSQLLAHAHGELAWLILLDPYALTQELAAAEKSLEIGLDVLDQEHYPIEVANQLVNLAYLRVRQSLSPETALGRAEALLTGEDLSWEGVSQLRDWSTLVRALDALAAHDLDRAIDLCGSLIDRDSAELAAWALSCQGRAERQQGNLQAAAWSFEQSLLRHEYGQSEELGQQLPLGPDRQADDFAEAARLALELGSPDHAWELLTRLDHLTVDSSERRRCREQARTPEVRQRWLEIDRRSQLLLHQLTSLSAPAAGQRRAQTRSIRRELQTKLRQAWGEIPGCEDAPKRSDEGVDFRAVALEDEILLLRRKGDGSVELERRTPLARRELVWLTRDITEALAERRLSDDAWRHRFAPLAQALLPKDNEKLPEVSTFALHGLLQDVPLAALPIPSRPDRDSDVLADLTIVALRSAGSRPRVLSSGDHAPLFVVNPLGDLRGAESLLPTYRRLFPQAKILHGSDASSANFRAMLPAAWLHIDAHGLYDAGFPEFSAIQLADRPLSLVELAELPTSFLFANLSGCQTGRWPTTADSGRYGIAGLLSRLGAPWVIGSRADLEDEVAAAFNREFYRELQTGGSVPDAYRHALAEVRARFTVVRWAGLLLLSNGSGSQGAKRMAP